MDAPLTLALVAVALLGVSGMPAACRWSVPGERLAAGLAVGGATVGLLAALLSLMGSSTATVSFAWGVPAGALTLGLDALSAVFLIPVSLIPGVASVYGLGYFRPGGDVGRGVRLFQGLMSAGMVVVLLARNGVLFLFGWEIMAVSAFLLIATEHRLAAARQAAWIYLVATHIGTFCLLAAFALLPAGNASLDWAPAAIAALPPERALLVFALAFVGFGFKAGVMPLHVWLPAAHANAPSHVSAVLSGVVIKMGAYGVLRMLTLLPAQPAWCGALVTLLGIVTAVVGIAVTLRQGDLKRLLAYSSVENIGIVFAGIGLGMVGRAASEPSWVVLGFGAALLHTLNHSLFKPLLFLATGAVVHATGTRRLDALGGMIRRMPRTAAAFFVGALAIVGLPPLNGFVSEVLLYLGLFAAGQSASTGTVLLAAVGLVGLAMTGALAAASFVRVFGIAFLGTARTLAAAQAHEARATMTGPTLALATLCALVGAIPWAVTPVVDAALACMPAGTPLPTLGSVAPLAALSWMALGTLVAVGAALAWLSLRRRGAVAAETWSCGYAEPGSPRIQYTAAGFAQLTNDAQTGAPPEHRRPKGPQVLFPAGRAWARPEREFLLHRVLLPWFHRQAERCLRLRILQHGNAQAYLLYIMLAFLLLLGWSSFAAWWWA